MSESTAFYCNVRAFSPTERSRYNDLARKLSEACVEFRELPDGYALLLLPEKLSLIELAEFVSLESRCCPFFDFDIELVRDNGPLWLKLRGSEGMKPFIRAEFGVLGRAARNPRSSISQDAIDIARSAPTR
jgi:hypothetical protein